MIKQWLLPGTLFLLSLISILILRSVAPQLLVKQVLFFMIGAVIFVISSKTPFQRWHQWSWPIYGIVLLCLGLTQVVATVTRGTRSWVEIGPFHAQPSQLAIAAGALAIGKLIAYHHHLSLKRYLLLLATLLAPAVLIFLEPDLGTTVIYLLACGVALLFYQVPIKYLMMTAISGVAIIMISWLFLLKPYQKQRLTSFLATDAAPRSASYNAVQSMIAVGSGNVTGKGLGQGTQSQLRFLPERQTDFVFASFAEETGFIGGTIVVACYALIIILCIWGAAQSRQASAQLFALITGVMCLAQVGVNIGMNIGLVPITGITLPFISYGGSSILALCWQLGCFQGLISELKPQPKRFIR